MIRTFFKMTLLAMSIVILLVLVGNAEAKGAPDKVIIIGPGLETPIEISERGELQDFSIYSFEQINQRIPAPKDPGQGYVIIRYPYDWLIYYSQPGEKQGYVFYKGLLPPRMSSEFDGYWYRASERGDATMRRILVAVGVIDESSKASTSAPMTTEVTPAPLTPEAIAECPVTVAEDAVGGRFSVRPHRNAADTLRTWVPQNGRLTYEKDSAPVFGKWGWWRYTHGQLTIAECN